MVLAQDTEVPVEPPTEVPFEPSTDTPTTEPTNTPTDTPTTEPTNTPTDTPTTEPTNTPTETPTIESTNTPTETLASTPTVETTTSPTATPTTGSPRTRTSTRSTRSNAPTNTDDPDYYLGRIDAWLTSEISAGDILRTDMANPRFGDAEWYIDQTSAVGLILSTDEELQGLDQSNPDLNDVHRQVLAASSDQAAAAGNCDQALVSTDADDAAGCQVAIETSTRSVQDLRDAIADWDGSDGDLVTPRNNQPRRPTIEPTVEPTATPGRMPRRGASTAAARPTATVAPDDEATDEPDPAAESGSGETRDSPLGVGETGVVGDYEITVLSVTPNADDLVAAENEFNDPPAAGEQFFIARLSVTYTGSETGNPALDLNYQSVGDSSASYTTFDNSCGVVPDDEYTLTELFEGGSAEVNICWAIDRDDADSLEMYVEPLFDFNSDRIWFSLDDSN